MNDWNPPEQNVDEQKPKAFCQNCGKSLDNESMRKVGPAIYCEPCLAARIAGAQPPPPGATSGYGPVNTGSPSGAPSDTVWQWGAGMPPGWTPGQGPNPGLAALLGLIPGVGAMYNEQYAKGVVHLVIFAVLVMFSHISGIFGLFVVGWICYMSIEAHHTAKARRDGTPLPNPFGLNDIGERMGFGKAWPGAPDVVGAARDAAQAAAAGFAAATPPFTPPATPPQPAATAPGWGAPVDAYPPPYAPPAATYSTPYAQAYKENIVQDVNPNPNYAYQNPYGNPVPPYAPTFHPDPSVPPIPQVAPNRFPTGAVVLIALGAIFLLGTMGIFNAVPGSALIGTFLLGLGVFIFLRRMTDTGEPLAFDGSPAYSFRVLRALRGSVWLIAIGILELLDSFRIVRWEYSWPTLVILAGVMMLLRRAAWNAAATTSYVPVPPAPEPAPAPASETSSEPTQEGN